MKKFFSLFVTAAVALFGLTCCGGGGDSEPGIMTVKDFANGAKKFVIQNRIRLEIIPIEQSALGSNVDPETSSTVTMLCRVVAGNGSPIDADVTYTQESENQYKMTYTFYDIDDLEEKQVIAAFGFSPIIDNGGTSWTMPDSIPSLAVLDITSHLDMETHEMQTTGEYNVFDPESNQMLQEKGRIPGQVNPFAVVPN